MNITELKIDFKTFFIIKFPIFCSSTSTISRECYHFFFIGGNSKHQVGRSKICYWHELRILALFKVHLHLQCTATAAYSGPPLPAAPPPLPSSPSTTCRWCRRSNKIWPKPEWPDVLYHFLGSTLCHFCRRLLQLSTLLKEKNNSNESNSFDMNRTR